MTLVLNSHAIILYLPPPTPDQLLSWEISLKSISLNFLKLDHFLSVFLSIDFTGRMGNNQSHQHLFIAHTLWPTPVGWKACSCSLLWGSWLDGTVNLKVVSKYLCLKGPGKPEIKRWEVSYKKEIGIIILFLNPDIQYRSIYFRAYRINDHRLGSKLLNSALASNTLPGTWRQGLVDKHWAKKEKESESEREREKTSLKGLQMEGCCCSVGPFCLTLWNPMVAGCQSSPSFIKMAGANEIPNLTGGACMLAC